MNSYYSIMDFISKTPGILSIKINESLYKELYNELSVRVQYNIGTPNPNYRTPIEFLTATGTVKIEVDWTDRELKDIYNGIRKVCL